MNPINAIGVATILALSVVIVTARINNPAPSEEELRGREEARVSTLLPPGCTVHLLGRVDMIDNVVAVTCAGTQTVATRTSDSRMVGRVHVRDENLILTFGQTDEKP